MTIVAALVVVGLLVAALPQGRIVGESFAYAICQVVTFGQGGCAPPSTSPEAHVPTEPCVVSQNGIERNQKVSVVVVTAEDGRRIEIAELSNGEYRVTVTDSESGGVEVGVGGGVSLTVNDTTVGGSATANAGASLDIQAGEVYYADGDNIDSLMDALLQDQIKDTVVGEGGPIRWVTDGVGDLIGVNNDLPEPDEVYAEGGISLNASAEATGVFQSGSAGVEVAEVLGTRTNRDGTVTVYLTASVEGEVGLQSLGIDTSGPEYQGLSLEGSAEVMTAVTFDSKGNMVSVSATAATSGSSSGITSALFGGELDPSMSNTVSSTTIFQANLDLEDDGDRTVANQFLLAQGVGALGGYTNPLVAAGGAYATSSFFQAAADRGTITQQSYDTSASTVFGFDASGKLGIELGVSADVKQDSMEITEAEYWDGAQWVDWEECAA